ncbi:MAG: type II and III secretion system protein family protein [Janthinobacterium lividum]
MRKKTRVARALLLSLPMLCPGVPVDARPRPAPAATGAQGATSVVTLNAGSGRVLQLSGVAANVFAADPKVAEVRPASTNSLFIFGVAPGRTTVAAMDANGRPVGQWDVVVQPSTYASSQATAAIATALPGQSVSVDQRPDGMVLHGRVGTPEQAERAAAAAHAFSGKQPLENRLTVSGQVQVSLRVRIAEMDRNITRELGINWQQLGGDVGKYASFGLATNNVLADLTNTPSAISAAYTAGSVDLNAVIDALSEDQLIHLLAEPNLTAMSGETASFLVGGEYPVPVAQSQGQITVDFKQYGVSLAFSPTVMSDGRINLHVRPEVSALTTQGAVRLVSTGLSAALGGASLTIPALSVRRADTTVELGSGQSFAIAGLLQDQDTLTGLGLPFLADLPILGALFRSDSFQKQETELVIVVTPYIVKPVSNPDAVHLPTDNWRPPSDLERLLLLRQSARGGPAQPVHIPGDAGFLVE